MKTAKRRKTRAGIAAEQERPFMGEIMTCHQCGGTKRSNPHASSGWTLIQLDNIKVYICPRCFDGLPNSFSTP